jgi:serine/threonine protein kinase
MSKNNNNTKKTKTKPSPKTKTSPKTSSKDKSKILFNIKAVAKIYKDRFEEINKGGLEKWRELKEKLEQVNFTDDEEKLINMLNSYIDNQKFMLTRTEMRNIATEFIPTNKKDKHSCMMEYKDIQEKESGHNRFHDSIIYYATKDTHKYVIKVKSLEPMTEFNKKHLMNEIKLAKLASEKGLSPKIHNIFFCQTEKGKDKLFMVMDNINGGNLSDYTKDNKLTQKEQDMIKKLINDFFDNDIYISYVGEKHILVELDEKKKAKRFYLTSLGWSLTLEDLRKKERESVIRELDWLSDINEYSKINICIKDLVHRKLISVSTQ